MIVVDTNVLAYFWLRGEHTEKAKNLYLKDNEWVVPFLWRSEFRNILTLYVRKNLLPLNDAFEIINEAEEMLKGNEYSVDSISILGKVKSCNLSAYDLEFVALAEMFDIKLITLDKKILKAFPKRAKSL